MKKKVKSKTKTRKPRFPKVGDKIYVPTSLHVYRGADDFQGGLCTISRVSPSDHLPKDHYNYWMVGIAEGDKSTSYNWRHLMEEQEKLKKRFGKEKGYKDPDLRPEFNNDDADWHPVFNAGAWD